MKIIIVGCGKIGTAVVDSLEDEGHDLIAVDSSQEAINELTDLYDIMCVCGSGTEVDTLKEAGAADCQLFVAVTGSDETNMLACLLAKGLGAEHTIARIRNPEYNDNSLSFLSQQLTLSEALNPDRLAAQEICNILKFPAAVNIERFSGRFELIELIVGDDTPIKGLSLSQLRRDYTANFLVCAVQRDDTTYIPSGNFVLAAGDRIALTAAPYEVQKLLKKMGILQKSARNVMILGISHTSYYLAKMLAADGVTVKIIEKSREQCEKFVNEFDESNIMLINGDGARQEVLLEEGLTGMDAFVSLTGSDEENILVSIYAASRGVPKVIAKVNRPELAAMAEKLGLDCIISSNKITSARLASYARALRNSEGSSVEALYRILDEDAEALEFNVSSDFPYFDIPLKDMHLRRDILIAGILRGRRPIIPSGSDCIRQGDRVVVISAGHRLNDLSDIFRTEQSGDGEQK